MDMFMLPFGFFIKNGLGDAKTPLDLFPSPCEPNCESSASSAFMT